MQSHNEWLDLATRVLDVAHARARQDDAVPNRYGMLQRLGRWAERAAGRGSRPRCAADGRRETRAASPTNEARSLPTPRCSYFDLAAATCAQLLELRMRGDAPLDQMVSLLHVIFCTAGCRASVAARPQPFWPCSHSCQTDSSVAPPPPLSFVAPFYSSQIAGARAGRPPADEHSAAAGGAAHAWQPARRGSATAAVPRQAPRVFAVSRFAWGKGEGKARPTDG